MSFLQTEGGPEVKFLGTNNSFFPEIVCNKCKFGGHYAADCPVVIDNTGASLSGGRRNRSRGSRRGRGGRGTNGRWTLIDHGGGGTVSGAGNGIPLLKEPQEGMQLLKGR